MHLFYFYVLFPFSMLCMTAITTPRMIPTEVSLNNFTLRKGVYFSYETLNAQCLHQALQTQRGNCTVRAHFLHSDLSLQLGKMRERWRIGESINPFSLK